MDWSRNQVKLFRTLLLCYPAEFRHEYGAEMEQLFADRLRSEPRVRLWAETLADVFLSAATEHWQTLLLDVKHGTRMLAAEPAFAAVTILVLAFGIACSVSVFSVSNAVLFRSLPYAQPENLVYLWSPNPNFKGVPAEMGPNVPDFFTWQKQSRSFSSMAAFRREPVNLVRSGRSMRVGTAFVTHEFFQTLGVAPQLGRVFGASEDQPGHERVALLSDALWRAQFASAPGIIGQKIQLNRDRYTVLGVMPRDFGYPLDGDVPYEHSDFTQTDLWVPAAYRPAQKTDRSDFASADAIGRLRAGVSSAAAQAELRVIESRVEPLYPPEWRGWSVLVRPLTETIMGPVERIFWTLLGAVALLMLIAISNVANLLFARTFARAHELGIRNALGAEQGRIVRQLVTESLLLSVTGGSLGVLLALLAIRVLLKLNPGGIPRFETAALDARVVFFAAALAIASGVLSGIVPALFAARMNIYAALRSGGRSIHSGFTRSRMALIAVEVALAVILLTGSGLLIRSYLRLAAVDPGFSSSTLTFGVELDSRYDKPELRSAFYKRALDQFSKMPGVRYAGASSSVPLNGSESVTFAEIRGYGKPKEVIENRSVTTDFRRALGIPLLRGRDFNLHDVTSRSPVVMVNRRFAQVYFGGRDPIGGEIRIGIGDLSLSHTNWSTVVGLVGDARQNSLEEAAQPQMFQPDDSGDHFALACLASCDNVANEARAVLRSLDPVLTLEDVQTMGERMGHSRARRSFETALLTGFASIALGLALAGLYGLMSYTVRQRTREIGVRLALGSSRSAISGLILSQGLRLTLAGLLAGVAGALAVTHLLSAWLFEVKPFDVPTLLAVIGLILVVASCACLVPALAATRVDPLEALRHD